MCLHPAKAAAQIKVLFWVETPASPRHRGTDPSMGIEKRSGREFCPLYDI